MAAVNANYEFIFIDFGMNGRISDGGVIKIYKALSETFKRSIKHTRS